MFFALAKPFEIPGTPVKNWQIPWQNTVMNFTDSTVANKLQKSLW